MSEGLTRKLRSITTDQGLERFERTTTRSKLPGGYARRLGKEAEYQRQPRIGESSVAHAALSLSESASSDHRHISSSVSTATANALPTSAHSPRLQPIFAASRYTGIKPPEVALTSHGALPISGWRAAENHGPSLAARGAACQRRPNLSSRLNPPKIIESLILEWASKQPLFEGT